MSDNWAKNILEKIDESIKKYKLKPIFEVIALIVAITVMVNMWCTYGVMKDSVDKMREQNKLSQESLKRMDSAIALAKEANELTNKSIAVAESSFTLGVRQLREEIRQGNIREDEHLVKDRPRLVVVPLQLKDITEDSLGGAYFVNVNVLNKGVDDARDVEIKIFVVGPKLPLGDSVGFPFDIFQSNGAPKACGVGVPKNLGSFDILVEIKYNWKPGVPPFREHKAYSISWNDKEQKYTKIEERDENYIRDTIMPALKRK